MLYCYCISEISIKFFKTVQNKVHYTVHGKTAAEVIFDRVDAEKKNLGLILKEIILLEMKLKQLKVI